MKRLYLFVILLILLMSRSFGQTKGHFTLDKLSVQDTLLSGWVFHSGDDPLWATPGFDDSKWQSIDPGTDITKFDQLKNAGVGWLRLHIKADSALTRQGIIAWVSQYSASEIYLDGKLIQQCGYISHDPGKTIAVTPAGELFELKLKGGFDQVIAVRLGYQSRILYTSPLMIPLPAFSMYINRANAAMANSEDLAKLNQKLLVMNSIATGIFLILCFIHLLYFVFDRSQKISLYYLIYCVCMFYIYLTFDYIYYQGHSETLSTFMLIFNVGIICFCVAFLFLVLVVYVLFDYRERTVFKVLVILALPTLLGIFLDDIISNIIVSIVFPVLCMLEVARICFLALKQKRKDAAIIFPVICLYIILYVWEGLLDQTTILATILIYFVFLGLPVAIAIYLGIKTASTNRTLKTTLGKVRTLSQEKQQILADQNEQLERQVTARTAELNQSLSELKSTQSQLIQSEKMASLGELTAGIAHEIQNPLNFVNNFSEVNTELLTEMVRDIQDGNIAMALETAAGISTNMEKINYHGKRADTIVKSMLQHSGISTGQKEPTDINALTDEYLRLSYHGFRAKDKTFNAALHTDFDPSAGKINIVPQDIGRALLNLFNNAFYALAEHKKQLGDTYSPQLSIMTRKSNSGIEIRVRDNGSGIATPILNKIFQPFFTTKSPGQGTGLGLSLSYDIVTKEHGGQIRVESQEGEYTEFIIWLPVGGTQYLRS